MRLIDADKIQWTSEGCGHPYCKDNCECTKDGNAPCGLMLVKKRDIEKMPTVYPVPTKSQFRRMAVQLGYVHVVMCKNCHWWREVYDGYGWCKYGLKIGFLSDEICTNENEFCSRGERRNDV